MPAGADLLISLLLGLVGWYAAAKIKMPGAAIIGPMIFLSIGALGGLPVVALPDWFKIALQVVVGTYSGAGLTRQTVLELRSYSGSVVLVTVWTVLSAMLIGYLAAQIAGFDLATSLLGATPGGLAEMTAIALAVGANAPLVAVIHTFRLVSTLAAIPIMVRRAAQTASSAKILVASAVGGLETPTSLRLERNDAPETVQRRDERSLAGEPRFANESSDADRPPASRANSLNSAKDRGAARFAWLMSLGIGAAGALALTAASLPGGAVVGAILAVGLAGVIKNRVELPPAPLRDAALFGMGIAMGESVTPQTGTLLLSSLPVVVVVTVGIIGSSLMLAGLVQRQLKIDAPTAILACAPGGLSQMPLVAAEVGANMGSVTVFQLTRFLASIVVLPVLFRLLL